MEYLSRCIKEALRLHSPVPFVMRQITKDTEIEGIQFPKGSRFTIHLYNLHHNPHVWEDPFEYRPDRFLPENLKQKDSFAFVPFSAGPRYMSVQSNWIKCGVCFHQILMENKSHPLQWTTMVDVTINQPVSGELRQYRPLLSIEICVIYQR